jgi:hypothetical protein
MTGLSETCVASITCGHDDTINEIRAANPLTSSVRASSSSRKSHVAVNRSKFTSLDRILIYKLCRLTFRAIEILDFENQIHESRQLKDRFPSPSCAGMRSVVPSRQVIVMVSSSDPRLTGYCIHSIVKPFTPSSVVNSHAECIHSHEVAVESSRNRSALSARTPTCSACTSTSSSSSPNEVAAAKAIPYSSELHSPAASRSE